MSEYSVPYGEGRIRFAVALHPARNGKVAIHVGGDGSVSVDAPADTPMEQIRAAVKRRAHWISKHQEAARVRLEHVLPREYVSGEAFHYLGRRYTLKVCVDAGTVPSAALRGRFIHAIVPERDREAVRQVLQRWYQDRAKAFLAGRVAAYCEQLPWLHTLPAIHVRAMRIQWGSCSPGGRISLNRSLVMAPRECIDYVVLHELCHMKCHNHSRDFYRLLTRHMPAWQARKDRLDGLAETLLR